MKQQLSTFSSIVILGLLLCFGLYYRYPHAIRSFISRFIPGVEVNFERADIRYADTFNDQNARQLAAAKKAGLPEVPQTRKDVDYSLVNKISTCADYRIATLTHSVPYLVPAAADELGAIGSAFRERLSAAGLPEYRIIVTSVLRSMADVQSLMKTNRNATANSAHCYGTTFDIAWSNFDRTTSLPKVLVADASNEDLKSILGEVLLEERKAGRIFVKYEINERCFHITSRAH